MSARESVVVQIPRWPDGAAADAWCREWFAKGATGIATFGNGTARITFNDVLYQDDPYSPPGGIKP